MVSRSGPPRFKRRPKKANTKIATVGTVKRMITNRIDRVVAASSTAGAAMSGTGTVYSVSIVNGVLRYYNYELRCSLNQVTAASYCRLVLFQFSDTSTPTTADVLASATTLDVYKNVSDFSKYVHVLYDKTFDLDLTSNINKHVIMKISGKKLRKQGQTNDGYPNMIYLLAIGPNGGTTLSTMYYRYIYSLE